MRPGGGNAPSGAEQGKQFRPDSAIMLQKIVSGGQTGVDRAALDAAIGAGLDHGGWCPAGRRAEDGAIPERYHLHETPSKGYRQRTDWNVRDSSGTLVLVRLEPAGGTRYTVSCARRYRKPLFMIRLDGTEHAGEVVQWVDDLDISVLNVAGPRESSDSTLYDDARSFLEKVISYDRMRIPAGS
jgi:hypothetical protein